MPRVKGTATASPEPEDGGTYPELIRILLREQRDDAWHRALDVFLGKSRIDLQKRFFSKYGEACRRLFDEFFSIFQVRLLELFRLWTPRRGQIMTFLWKCADNLFLDLLRQEERRRTVSLSPPTDAKGRKAPEIPVPADRGPTPLEHLVREENTALRMSRAQEALRVLPPERRVCLLVSYRIPLAEGEDKAVFEKMTGLDYAGWYRDHGQDKFLLKELAALFRVRPNTLAQWNRRSLMMLRKSLKERHDPRTLP